MNTAYTAGLVLIVLVPLAFYFYFRRSTKSKGKTPAGVSKNAEEGKEAARVRDVEADGSARLSEGTTGSRGATRRRTDRGIEVGAAAVQKELLFPKARPPGSPPGPGDTEANPVVDGPGAVITDTSRLAQLAQHYFHGPLHQLPALTGHFTGRLAELQSLCSSIRERVKEGQPAAVVSVITGTAGVGKTTLAVAAGYALAGDFPDAHIILRLASHSPSPAKPEQVRDDLLYSVHRAAKLSEDDRVLWKLYQNIFHEDNGQPRRALLILDDVSSVEQVHALLPPPGCAVIVTTRSRLKAGQSLPLSVLPRAGSTTLLRAFRESLTTDEADEAAELCGDRPVALNVAGAFLQRHSLKPAAEYIAELRADRQQKDDPGWEVNAVLGRSAHHLSPSQLAAFHRLAMMTCWFDREAALAVAGCQGSDLDELAALNLLEFHPHAKRYDWHDLIHEFAAKSLTPEVEHAARMSHAVFFTKAGARADELFLAGGGKLVEGLALFDMERRHIEAAFEFLVFCSRSPLAADIGSRYPCEQAESGLTASVRFLASSVTRQAAGRQLLSLVNAVAFVGDLRFNSRLQLIPWLEAHLDAVREIGDPHGESQDLSNLGNAHYSLGDARKAMDFYERALAIDREIGNRRGEGRDLGNVGLAYAALGDPRKAIDLHEQALAIGQETGDREAIGDALGNMGNAYADLGETRKAIELYEQRLAIAREIGDRYGESNALGNLGLACADLGDTRKAIGFYEQALAIARETGHRRGEGIALGNLANAWADLGDTRKAMGLYEQRLAIAREIGDRRAEGNVLSNLGLACASLGDVRKAIEYHEQRLVIARDIGDQLGEGSALGNLGLAYAALGEPRKAIEYYEQRLVIARDIGDRRSEGSALGSLATAYDDVGDTRKAIDYYEQRLVIARQLGDTRGEANALWNSAMALDQLHQRPKAISRAVAALRIYEQIEDPYARKVRPVLAKWRGET